MTTTLRLMILSAALALTACGPPTKDVTMGALNDSGQDGTATLTQEGNDVKVVVDIKPGESAEQTGHIHEGDCPGLGAVKYPLNNIVNGKSTTVIANVKLDSLGKTAINIHSAANPNRYVSCGVIP